MSLSQPTFGGLLPESSRDTFRIPARRETSFIEPDRHQSSVETTPSPIASPASLPPNRHRSSKQARSASTKERILKRDPPKEKVNYPCHYPRSEPCRKKLIEMQLYPDDGVHKYTRQIPFKGLKESFLKKTGRPGFDVYEYRFTARDQKGELRYWWVMWDYYNGLVRIHDIFDCCKPGKTEPGNAVKDRVNPGLSSICHNITGGNLHAQGYWLPFEAAKALLSKFCYPIRYALVIIFGEDFPDKCLPEDHGEYGDYTIDPQIISDCTANAKRQLQVEQQRSAEFNQRPASSPYVSSSESTPSNAIFRVPTPDESPVARTLGRPFFDPVRGDYTRASSTTADIRPSDQVGSSSTVYNGSSKGNFAARRYTTPSNNQVSNGTVTPTSSPHQSINFQSDHSRSPDVLPSQYHRYRTSSTRRDHARNELRSQNLPDTEQHEQRIRGLVVDDDSEMARASKRQKCDSDQPPVNPYMQQRTVDFENGIETFRNSRSVARINTIPITRNAFTRAHYEFEMQRQQDEDPEKIELYEAAGTLVSLAMQDHQMQVVKEHKPTYGRRSASF